MIAKRARETCSGILRVREERLERRHRLGGEGHYRDQCGTTLQHDHTMRSRGLLCTARRTCVVFPPSREDLK
jgi:hypothetical protein